jgi:predicted SnoaL-like aldol condensation-catalyzing enzyme
VSKWETVAEAGRLERNKLVVRRFFEEVGQGTADDLDVVEELVAEDYLQHNPHAGQGREGLRDFFVHILSLPLSERLDPRETLQVNLIAEGDFVVRQELRTNGMLVDIFRVQNGRLQEHWDAYRPAPGADPLPGF